MQDCFNKTTVENSLPLYLVTLEKFPAWLLEQSLQVRTWLDTIGFKVSPASYCLLPDASGGYQGVLAIIESEENIWAVGALPLQIPEGDYHIATKLNGAALQQVMIAWALGAYQFDYYCAAKRAPACLAMPEKCHVDLVDNIIEATYLVRDLINMPSEEMSPLELAEVAMNLSEEHHASVTQIVGEELLEESYPAIFMVGRAGYNAPRLIDMQWGDEHAPKLTLVGKGVCFDTGGLNLKSSKGMALMKKDMGGAAHALGLAKMIMQAGLPVNLRVLIPAVENVVSMESYRPGDIIRMRNGKTVEVTDTDAEGRLVLADALTEACIDKPDLLIDFATLTGAARVAVGTEIAAMLSNDETVTKSLMAFGEQNCDPIWSLPLYLGYRKMLESPIADLVNATDSWYAGAITAGLFLQEFVDADVPWVHFDLMAWNLVSRPGHPQGGEAMALRAVFDYLRHRFSAKH